MPHSSISFQYEEDQSENSITGLAGLPVCLDLMSVMHLSESIRKHVQVRLGSQGWTDAEQIMSIILLNVAGGDCVDDIEKLNADRGLCRILSRLSVEAEGLNRQQRRELLRKREKEKTRTVPSPTAIRTYLKEFHNKSQEAARNESTVKAFIPEANRYLAGLRYVNADLLSFVQSQSPTKIATIDVDATLVYADKKQALHCYKGPKAYQPLNAWWSEHKLILHTEFRDGNVPAGYENLRLLSEALELLPDSVEEVWLRSDTAAYQHDLLRYCERGVNERFGRIKFAIGCNVTSEFKSAVSEVPQEQWTPVRKLNPRTKKYEDTHLECAEVCFVPSKIGNSKKGLEYRYIATRELMSEQQLLPTIADIDEQQKLPFQTITLSQQRYKLHGLVTNIGMNEFSTGQIVEWLHDRCGYSEQAHSIMKRDFAGSSLPSKYFGANAAWWWMMILALNVTQTLKLLALGARGSTKRMKALRFSLFNIPGRVIEHARQLIIRIAKGHPSFQWLLDIRRRIAALVSPAPT